MKVLGKVAVYIRYFECFRAVDPCGKMGVKIEIFRVSNTFLRQCPIAFDVRDSPRFELYIS